MGIPSFPEFAPLGLEHKSRVDLALERVQPVISEFTFTNLFIWRHHYRVSISDLDGFLLFLAEPSGKKPFLFPPWGDGDAAAVITKCLEFLREKENGGCLERLPEDYLKRHAGALAGVETVADPDNDDYVYDSQDLISLRGRKYDGKRNAIRKFQREWRWEYRPIDDQLIGLCLQLQDFWCVERKCELYPGLAEERRAIAEVFGNYQALGMRGGAVLLDGKVEAFSLGERLNNDTFVVHIEKANQGIPGLYSVINQQFAEHETAGFRYVNREQDLGDEGLRTAKESYQPVFKVRKFRGCVGR
ncbi:MAG: DUF2156 domain-containing protein [Chloroflexi bacterium]|nr:DUF2156 domain-containing protein [Chloroflexota bacterium]